MAFKLDDLLRRGPEIWTYRTTDSLSTVLGAGYFNAALDKMEAGDQILVSVLSDLNATPGTTASLQRPLLVTGLSAGAVSVALADGGIPTGYINVLDYGADPTGVADSTAAIQDAIAAAQAAGGGSVVIPDGTVKVTAQISVRGNNITIRGVSLRSRVNFVPTADGTLFDFAQTDPSTTQLNGCGVDTLTIYSTDTTYSKVAIANTNASRFLVNRVGIYGATIDGSWWSGGDSVGVYTKGREQLHISDIAVYASVPLRFGRNPSSVGGHYDMDHTSVTDVILSAGGSGQAPATLPHACVLLDNNLRISVASFDGHIAFVGGKYKVYWASSGLTEESGTLRISNFLTEQASDLTGWDFYIDLADAGEDMACLDLQNGILQGTNNGIHVNNVQHTRLRNIRMPQTTGKIGLQVQGASAAGAQTVSWDDMKFNATSPASIIELPSDLALAYAGGASWGDGRAYPPMAHYTKGYAINNVSQRPFLKTGAVASWNRSGLMTSGTTWTLPISKRYNSVSAAMVTLIAVGNSSACTFTAATPGVVTMVSHGFASGSAVKFSTTGSLPAALTAGTTYYVIALTADTFNVEASLGGGAIDFATAGTGVHTCSGTLDVSGMFSIGQGGAVKQFGNASLIAGNPIAGQIGLAVVAGQTGMDYCTLTNSTGQSLQATLSVDMQRA